MKKAGTHTSAQHEQSPHPFRLQTLYSRSVERIPVRGVDAEAEHGFLDGGCSDLDYCAIVSLEERWGSGRYMNWGSISHQDLRRKNCQGVEQNGKRIHTRLR